MNPLGFVMFLFMVRLLGNEVPHMIERSNMVDEYGSWAVGRAEAVCPEDDLECVRKEAARLQRTQLAKIGMA